MRENVSLFLWNLKVMTQDMGNFSLNSIDSNSALKARAMRIARKKSFFIHPGPGEEVKTFNSLISLKSIRFFLYLAASVNFPFTPSLLSMQL